MKENLKVSTAFLLFFLISSCSSFSFYKVPVTQGNIFEEEDIEKLQVGQSMDQDLGSSRRLSVPPQSYAW